MMQTCGNFHCCEKQNHFKKFSHDDSWHEHHENINFKQKNDLKEAKRKGSEQN